MYVLSHLDLVGWQVLDPDDDATVVENLGMAHAVGFVVLTSTALMLMIFFSDDLLMVYIVVYCLVASYCLACLVSPWLSRTLPPLATQVWSCHLLAFMPLSCQVCG